MDTFQQGTESGKPLPKPACPGSSSDGNSFSRLSDVEKNSNTGEEDAGQGKTRRTAVFPETNLALGIVGWDGQDDPKNPQNFPPGRKWGLLALMSGITFVSPLASSMLAPAVRYVGAEFEVADEMLLSLTISIYLLGYAFGPLLIGPLSEIYGRRIALSSANWFLVVWQLGCAKAPNIGALLAFRLLAGIGGSGCMTLGAGVIADLFPVEKRGLATSLWSLGPLIGPVVGPICGGFVGEHLGWRWVFWILLMASGAMSACIELFNRETCAPVLIQWKTERLAKELGRTDLRSAYDKAKEKEEDGEEKKKHSVLATLKTGLKRPARLFFRSPIVFLLAVYLALVYGLLYLFFTTIPSVFESQYGFSTSLSGLAYVGIGVGFLAGLAVTAATNDRMMLKMAQRNGGTFEPEMRLPLMTLYAAFYPVSFFWYGWSAAKGVHWIVPILGMIPFGFGTMGLFLLITTYVIDSYPEHAASANATLTIARSLVSALLPLAGPKLFATLGLGWGNSLLGFISLGFVPVPIVFLRYGKAIREKYPIEL